MGLQNVRVSLVRNHHHTRAKHLSACDAQIHVGASKMVHGALRQHRVVLQLRLAQGRAVLGNDHELRATLAQRVQGRLVADPVLATLHDQPKAAVDRVVLLIALLLSGETRRLVLTQTGHERHHLQKGEEKKKSVKRHAEAFT